MSAAYTVLNYLGFFLAFAILFVGLFAVTAFLVYKCRKQENRGNRRERTIAAVFMVLTAIFMICSNFFLPTLMQVGDLILPGGYEVRKTAGTVEYVMQEDNVLLHYYDGSFCGGASVYIDGQYYYGLFDGSLRKGMLIELEYAHCDHNGDVLLRWQQIAPEQVEQIREEGKPQIRQQMNARTSFTISAELEMIAIWIQYICTAGFIGMVMLQRCFGRVKRPDHWNHRQDHRITYNWVVGGFRMVQSGSIWICLLCAIIRGMKYGRLGGAIPIVVLILGHLSFFLYDLSRRMEIDGELVTVSCFGREAQYPASELRLVKWAMTNKARNYFPKDQFSFDDWERVMDTHYSLVIVFSDGKQYRFPVDTHLGVRSAYEELAKLLDARSGASVKE